MIVDLGGNIGASAVCAAARRYGPAGSFWSACDCPERPVRVWEVWNEPNLATFWSPPNPRDYALLVQAVKANLRQADPDDSDGGPKPAWNAYVARSRAAAALPLPPVY